MSWCIQIKTYEIFFVKYVWKKTLEKISEWSDVFQ